MDSVAQWQQIDHRYGSVQALQGFSLNLRPGQITALLGPNGAGKSTAIGLLLGLLRVQGGRVSLFGQPPQQRSARLRLGAMLQRTDLPDSLRVGEHLQLFARYYANPLPVDEVLALVGLQAQSQRRYSALSGGQQRRVQLALALIGRPQLLVLDEPTVGMDLDSRQAFREALRRCRQGGCAVLLATHDLPEVEGLADRIALVRNGQLVADDTPLNIRARVALKQLRCRTQIPLERLAEWPEVAQLQDRDGRLELYSREPEALLRRLLAADPTLSELEVRGADLEQALAVIEPAATAQAA
ncbi:MAG: ABC transporter ATP-binding protein [Xanthomonadales bacterium]|nr:ABC transporter ATP-binding protein [Xanthomonadales bacterium]